MYTNKKKKKRAFNKSKVIKHMSTHKEGRFINALPFQTDGERSWK